MELTHESTQRVEQAAKEPDSQERDFSICRINSITDSAITASYLAPVGLLASLLVGAETRCSTEGQKDE